MLNRYRKPSDRDGWYEITPADANDILNKKTHNRPVRGGNVTRLASDILNKRWKENGESIVLNPDGSLADGQHRLTACKAANRPIQAYVVWLPKKCDEGMWGSYDTGASRNGSDIIGAFNMSKNHALAAAMVNRRILWLAATASRASGSAAIWSGDRVAMSGLEKNRSILVAWEKDPENWSWAVELTKKHSLAFTGLMPASLVGFVAYSAYVACRDKGKVEEFVSGLASGENLSAKDPRLVLRNRLLKEQAGSSRPNRTTVVEFCIKAWNHFYNGEKISKYQVSGLAGLGFAPED